MLRLLRYQFLFAFIYSLGGDVKNIIASDRQLKSCIDWANIKIYLSTKPSFVEFYIVYVSSF